MNNPFKSPGRRKPGEALAALEKYANVDPSNGYSDIAMIPLEGGTNGHGRLSKNGAAARKYRIEKIYSNGTIKILENGRHVLQEGSRALNDPRIQARIAKMQHHRSETLIAFRFIGFADPDCIAKRPVPERIRKLMRGQPCVFDNTPSNEVDHKFGFEDQVGFPSHAPDALENFQPISKPANDRKRDRCGHCLKSRTRPGVSHLGYPVDFTIGDSRLDPGKEGCKGCFYHDPVAFRNACFALAREGDQRVDTHRSRTSLAA